MPAIIAFQTDKFLRELIGMTAVNVGVKTRNKEAKTSALNFKK